MSCSGIVADDIVNWATGTFDAFDCTTYGGLIPGGIALMEVCDDATICAIAVAMFVPGWKYTLTRPTPYSDWDSMREIPFTVEERPRSESSTTRASMSAGSIPGYVQTTATTGMSINGKMSTGIRAPDRSAMRTRTAHPTAIVYGFFNARRTIHIALAPGLVVHNPRRRG